MTATWGNLITVRNLCKTYANGLTALDNIDLDIRRGEILALLGPNGAGKTTLISIICGLVNMSSGSVMIDGFDIIKDYRQTRSLIGLVPQELSTDAFSKVHATVSFSRGLFGKPPNAQYIDQMLENLSLSDKRDNQIFELSGGMKRRVMIAKALSHGPRILFLDEPTAGVDVELRKDMWRYIQRLREAGVTIILTTHYIEEAEEIADRVGVINQGKMLLIEDKEELMTKMGQKRLILELHHGLSDVPEALSGYDVALASEGWQLVYTYDTRGERTGITALLGELNRLGIRFRDLKTEQSSLEEIFVTLVGGSR